jgi:inosine-uridine nucleoside N-ribohydrolase
MRIALIFFIVLVFCSPAIADEPLVWIDADPACAMGRVDDVDDCWAIISALRSTNVRVVGISTVFGNADVEHTTATAHTLLQSIRQHEPDHDLPPISQGASRRFRKQMEIPPAVRSLADALVDQRLTILALGPMTNVAILLRHFPDLASRIDGIVAVAGQRPGQLFRVGDASVLHFHDLNVRKDPDAFDLVLQTGIPLHLIPFEVAQQVIVTKTDLRTLEGQGPLNTWIASRSVPWLKFWEEVLGAQGFHPFDALAVAYLLHPDQFTCQTIPAKLVRRRGLLVVRDTLEVSSSFESQEIVRYCSEVAMAIRIAPITLLAPEGMVSNNSNQ